MRLPIACIVEGHGEVQAVPILLRRLAAEFFPSDYLDIAGQPIRVPRKLLVKPGELERYIELAGRKIAGRAATFVIIDADDDCPAQLGPQLLARATAVNPSTPVSVVLCTPEYEAWFLAAARSLRGVRGIRNDLEPPPKPEAIPDTKGWLRKQMGRKYREVSDQPALTAVFDLAQARSADSFDKCYREVQRLLTILHQRAAGGQP
jgi:hypothetical protein